MGRSVVTVANPSVPLSAVVALLWLLLAVPAFAQRGDARQMPTSQDAFAAYHPAPGTGALLLTILSENGHSILDRQALLQLVDLTTKKTSWQTTEDASRAFFTDIPFGNYDIEVSAVGYLSVRKTLRLMDQLRPLQMEIVLQRDPSAVTLDINDASMPAKARKQTKRAISALKSGHLQEAGKQLDEAYKLAPGNPDLDFLLGYLSFQKKDLAKAGTYLGQATTVNPNHFQALSLLGRVDLERADYAGAQSALERAVAADSQSWLAHNLLADVYLHQRSFEKARAEAQLAIDKGAKGAASSQLLLGQSLVGLRRNSEAIQALNTFLQNSPHDPVVPQVKNLIAEIEKQESAQAQNKKDGKPPAIVAIADTDPLDALPQPSLVVSTWEPPSLDDVRPAVAQGVACPTEKVIQASGERVKQLVDDIARFAAVEELVHQSLDELGNPTAAESRKFNYVVSISEQQPGILSVEEYRAEHLGLKDFPDQIASSGFAALALVFHPDMRESFEMTCEGLGDWHGQATWLVHFRQRDDRPNRMHSYKVGDHSYTVSLKGRAWITADNFQIIRIESELVTPMPQIQLRSEHQIVEYGPIPFGTKNIAVWLPKSADIYFDFRRHRYHRRHSFDHYMLFSVDSEEKTKDPKHKAPSVPTAAATPSPQN